MRVCNIDKNNSNCNCTYEPCPRKGICCDCLRYHQKMDEVPACFSQMKSKKLTIDQ